jgi:hypothetical protein
VITLARLVVSLLGAEWAEGTGVMAGEVDSPQGTVKESMGFTVPRTDVATGSGPLSVSGFGTLPSMIFSRPGDGEILVTGLKVREQRIEGLLPQRQAYEPGGRKPWR